jgi:hypothetical protein
MSDGSTGANPGQHYEQTHLPPSTLDSRHPIMPQPNKSSCGNQPANVSLTMPVEKDSPTPPPATGRHRMSGPRNQIQRVAHSCLLTARTTYQCCKGPSNQARPTNGKAATQTPQCACLAAVPCLVYRALQSAGSGEPAILLWFCIRWSCSFASASRRRRACSRIFRVASEPSGWNMPADRFRGAPPPEGAAAIISSLMPVSSHARARSGRAETVV